ncbi:hypothetical protein ACQ4PT_025599 [Festuca glaucescens]
MMAAAEWWCWPLPAWLGSGAAWFVLLNVVVGAIFALSSRAQPQSPSPRRGGGSGSGSGITRRASSAGRQRPPPTEEEAAGSEVDAKAEEFIRGFKDDLRQQRLDSIFNYTQMLKRRAAGRATTPVPSQLPISDPVVSLT